jgi:hypothetical protein
MRYFTISTPKYKVNEWDGDLQVIVIADDSDVCASSTIQVVQPNSSSDQNEAERDDYPRNGTLGLTLYSLLRLYISAGRDGRER